MSIGLYFFEACAMRIACCTSLHHLSGDCSAQPGFEEMMGDSVSGNCADAMQWCVCASTIETLMEEVPTSIPSRSIVGQHQFNYVIERIRNYLMHTTKPNISSTPTIRKD